MTTTVLAAFPSPSQGVWHLFGILPIRAYALCIIVGIIAALVLGDRRWVARGGEQGIIYDIALWAVPFGLIGGRLYHVMTDWPKYFGDDGAGFLAALKIWDGGLGIWGAVALGAVGAWISCRRRGIPLPAFGDAVAPGIILAQAIGRLGNYFNQELYGRETDLPWGLTIFQRMDPSGVLSPHSLDGVSTGQVYAVVHPTFLYELLWNLLIFGVLIWADRRFTLGHGRLFALYVAGYCVGRFWVELMRSDTATLIAGIRVNTFTSTFVFIAAVVYIMVAPKGREDPTTLRGKDREDEFASGELVAVSAAGGPESTGSDAGDDGPAEAPSDSSPVAPEISAIALEGTEVAEALSAAPDDVADESLGGLGSVEGDDAVAAEDSVAEVHDAAVKGVTTAETASDDVAAEDPIGESVGGLRSVEGDDAAATDDAAAEVHDATVEGAVDAAAAAEDVAAVDDTADESVGGLGSVEGDDVVAADVSAAEVHDAAVAGVATAESASEVVAAEGANDDSVGGLGSVEGDDAVAAEDSVAEVHDAAVEGAVDAKASAEDVAAVGDTADESVGGLGSVEGDDAFAAEDSAAEVHKTAVEGAVDAKASAEDVAAVGDTADESVGGLGSVEGNDAFAAEDSAAEVHKTAVEGAVDAEMVAEDVAAEADTTNESVGDLVDGDDAVAHNAAVGGVADADTVADEVSAEGATAAPDHSADDASPATDEVPPKRAQAARDAFAEVLPVAVAVAARLRRRFRRRG